MTENNTESHSESLNDVFALLTVSNYMLCETSLSLTQRAQRLLQHGLSSKLHEAKVKTVWISNIFYMVELHYKLALFVKKTKLQT